MNGTNPSQAKSEVFLLNSHKMKYKSSDIFKLEYVS